MNIPTNLISSYRNYFTEIGEAIFASKNGVDDRMVSIFMKTVGLLGLIKGVAGVIGFIASLPTVSNSRWSQLILL